MSRSIRLLHPRCYAMVALMPHLLPATACALLLAALLPARADAQVSSTDEPTTTSPDASPPDAIFRAPPPAEPAPPDAIFRGPEIQPLPSCAAGRVASELTLGRCCWPGQGFSAERGRCEGAPMCPAGWLAHGDDCVATTAVGAPAAAATTAPATTLGTRTAAQHGVIGAGVTLLFAGFTASATYGPSVSSSCDASSGLLWVIPFAGGLIGAATQRCSFGGSYAAGADIGDWVMASATAAFQVIGLILLIHGATNRRPITPRTSSVQLDLGPTPTLRF